jgi:hypothetical protein
MAIPFAGIPNPILTPGAYIEYNAERAVQGLAPLPNRVLLVGARLAAGAIPANTLTLIRSAGDADTMFGRGSQIGAMAKAFKAVNQTTELWGCGLTAAGTRYTFGLVGGDRLTWRLPAVRLLRRLRPLSMRHSLCSRLIGCTRSLSQRPW